MIGRLQGTVISKQPPALVLDVGGVGYELDAPMSTFFSLPQTGETTTLHTHLAVREDAMLLYGFASLAERSLFRDLIKVSGVGAKLALTILSGISVNDFIATVNDGDSGKLTGLPGVGKKTADRLIVEMRDRLGGSGSQTMVPSLAGDGAASAGASDPMGEAHNALAALGYKPAEATRLLKDLSPDEPDSEVLIREALKRAVR